ncbi:MAG: CDP-alcohol phosphatidyltransferase family protein [Patescibacteria group bacterium]|nr:CDP-alcohol phosphatidyltransferase family protein [Patescibacteria group bacterium]
MPFLSWGYPEKWNKDIAWRPQDRWFAKLVLPLVPAIVLPNHLTLVRLFLTPVVVWLVWRGYYLAALCLFVLLGFTDAMDGSLARVRRQVSEWGIRFDPVADKLLIGSVLFVIVLDRVNFYLGLALLIVEAAAVIVGWWRARHGAVEPSNAWGKAKMVFEVIGISALLLALWSGRPLFIDLSFSTLVLALIAAVISVFVRLK